MGSKVGADAGHLAPEQGEGHCSSSLVASHAQHPTGHAGCAHFTQGPLHSFSVLSQMRLSSWQCMPVLLAPQVKGL